MRVAVVHTLIEEFGGAERLMADMVRALGELGFEVDVYAHTVEDGVTSRLGLKSVKRLRCGGLRELAGRVLGASGRFVRLRRVLLYWACSDAVAGLRGEYDLVFETQSRILVPADASYIHFPMRLEVLSSGNRFPLYDRLVRYALSRAEKPPRLVLTNSAWTKRRILEVYRGIDVAVLHPPVRVEFFGEVRDRPFSEREKLVVTVSRFTWEKRLEDIPRIAKLLSDYEFVIAGATSKYSGATISRIASAIEGLGVKNVRLVFDPTSWELRELLGRARFYLHPPYAEHFGIAIAEAMAAGAIPVVYRDGGGWTDLVSPVDEGLGYTSIEEVVRIIRSVERDPEKAEKIRERAWSHVQRFRYESFRAKLEVVVEELMR